MSEPAPPRATSRLFVWLAAVAFWSGLLALAGVAAPQTVLPLWFVGYLVVGQFGGAGLAAALAVAVLGLLGLIAARPGALRWPALGVAAVALVWVAAPQMGEGQRIVLGLVDLPTGTRLAALLVAAAAAAGIFVHVGARAASVTVLVVAGLAAAVIAWPAPRPDAQAMRAASLADAAVVHVPDVMGAPVALTSSQSGFPDGSGLGPHDGIAFGFAHRPLGMPDDRRHPTFMVVQIWASTAPDDAEGIALRAIEGFGDRFWPRSRRAARLGSARPAFPAPFAARPDGIWTTTLSYAGRDPRAAPRPARAWVVWDGSRSVTLLDARGISDDEGAAIVRAVLDSLSLAPSLAPRLAAMADLSEEASVRLADAQAALAALRPRTAGPDWAGHAGPARDGTIEVTLARRVATLAEPLSADVPARLDALADAVTRDDESVPLYPRLYHRAPSGAVLHTIGIDTGDFRQSFQRDAVALALDGRATPVAGRPEVWLVQTVRADAHAALDPDMLERAAGEILLRAVDGDLW